MDEKNDDGHDDDRTNLNHLHKENVVELTINAASVMHLYPASLAKTIADIGVEFSNMKSKLRAAHSEITKLKNELTRRRPQYQVSSKTDFATLRRRVAFYCHPDRGGDAELMSRLNTLFDFLDTLEGRKGGSES